MNEKGVNEKMRYKANSNNIIQEQSIKMPQFFELGPTFEILNPYNFNEAIKRLESLTDDELINDLAYFTKKEFDFQNFDENGEEYFDGLRIVTSTKENNGQNTYIELVNISKDYMSAEDGENNNENFNPLSIKFNDDDRHNDLTIKCQVNYNSITGPLFKNFLEKSAFTCEELSNNVKSYKEKKIELEFIIKKNSINEIRHNSSLFLFDLQYPPTYQANYMKNCNDKENNKKMENNLFPFRIFNNEIANLKFKHFYFLLKKNPPVTPGNTNKNLEIPRNYSNLSSKLKIMFDGKDNSQNKVKEVTENMLNVVTEEKYKQANKMLNELSDYFYYDLHNSNKDKKGFINLSHPNPNLVDLEIIKFHYEILAVISEGLISYFNAMKFVSNVFSNENIYKETIFNSCPDNVYSPIFNETLTRLLDIYQNRGEEFSLSEFEDKLRDISLNVINDYQLKGINSISQTYKNKTLMRIQRVIVTPTLTLFTPHILDEGNRILRNFLDSPFHSMICVFKMDDHSEGRWSNQFLREFIKFVLDIGFELGMKSFRFFNFSQSQFRNMSCWLLINPDQILPLTGDYSKIKIVSKYGARVSQTLTTTRKTTIIKRESIKFIDDVVIKDDSEKIIYTFSDGVGKISYDLAKQISEAVNLNHVPSAFQGRFLGCKGVWTTMFDDHSCSIYIRPSQNKFSVPLLDEQYFELCDYSRYIQAYLNRQIIILLSALNIKDSMFLIKLDNYKKNLEDEKFVLSLIHFEEWNSVFNQMYVNGINMANDRLIKSIVESNKELLYNELKNKARIFVKESAYVIGIMDEYGILEYGEAFLHIVKRDLNMILDKKCTVAKCPCVHPGDIRKFHFKKYLQGDKSTEKYKIFEKYENVLIFPQKGKRPHPNELSGSDLDGDNYFVFYDIDLIPIETVEPMDFNFETQPSIVKEKITIKHIIEYFANYINLNNLGLIGEAHLAFADNEGADSEKAINLAIKFAKAVDAPKTGEPVKLNEDEHPKQFPHFMQKKNKSYSSTKILGKLYDKIQEYLKELSNRGNSFSTFYDPNLKLSNWDAYAFEALLFYQEYYDEMFKLLRKNEIKSESVLLTGNNIENEESIFSKKRHNYDLREKVTHQMVDLFKKATRKFSNGMKHIFPKNSLGNELNEEGYFKNKYHLLASACYIVCYDFPNIISKLSNIEEYEDQFVNEIYNSIDNPNETNDINEISQYEQESLGFDCSSFIHLDNYIKEYSAKKRENIKGYVKKLKNSLSLFFKECNNHFEIKQKIDDEENQYRILSFPWCFSGKILSNIKFLHSDEIKA